MITFLFQIDAFLFAKYLPGEKKRIEEFKKMAAILNNFAQKKIAQAKENLEKGRESSDFISVYLKEVEKYKGKLQDRYTKVSNSYIPTNESKFLDFRKETSG